MPSRRFTILLCLFTILVIAGSGAAYWWFELRYLRSFAEQTAFFDGSHLQLPPELAGPGPIRLVHFWDPDCPCNEGNQAHLRNLTARFGDRGIEFYSVQKPGSEGKLPSMLDGRLKALSTIPGADTLPASPAVAIWDNAGKLAYVGPYSEGMICTAGNSFIEPILEALVSGRSVRSTNTLSVGCYCNWQG
ncbi:thiol-disulfide isomerase [Pseudomonas luteola]|uniref:DUF6436 domain-containing protein n=1 Tax=Pseudomonas luteola TaxID=47886 RepID=UPI000F77037B|nr:DUF6436 domain-containing protein [Pseudomonas luteola]RRW47985.1 thiol-disulfide isomerase [Pseudomonas luteola]